MECRAAQLGLTGASQLRQKLEYDGDQAAAVETGGYIEQAQRLGIGPITGHDPSGATVGGFTSAHVCGAPKPPCSI